MKKEKKRRKNALVLCQSGRQFWTTQAQFWQWVRDRVMVKTADHPLTGSFIHESEDKYVVISNTVLNLDCPNHLSEALLSRRFGLKR